MRGDTGHPHAQPGNNAEGSETTQETVQMHATAAALSYNTHTDPEINAENTA